MKKKKTKKKFNKKKKKKKEKKRNSIATTRFLKILEKNSNFEKLLLNFKTSFYFDDICKTLALFWSKCDFWKLFFRFCVCARILMSIALEKYMNIESFLIKKNLSRNHFKNFSIIDHYLLIDVDRRNSNAQNIVIFFK